MGTWDQIETLVKEGKGAVVTLSEAHAVDLPKKKPEPISTRRKFERYAGCSNGISRPRCRAKGCNNYLRMDQPIACSVACANRLVDDALRVLAILKYHVIERVDDYQEPEHTRHIMEYAQAEGLI